MGYSESMIYQRNLRDMVLQVCPRMNYDAFKEYSKYKAQMEKQAQGRP